MIQGRHDSFSCLASTSQFKMYRMCHSVELEKQCKKFREIVWTIILVGKIICQHVEEKML